MHGYCEVCHRVRLVRVNMARLASQIGRSPVGVCAQCEEAEDERRKGRR